MAVFRQLIEALLNPFFLCLLLYAIAFLVLCTKGLGQKVRWSLGGVLLVFLILSTGFLPAYLTHQLEKQYPVIHQAKPDILWVVVLSGGQAAGDDLPANSLLYSTSIKRLVEGVRLFRHLPDAMLLLSGGAYAHDTPESIHMEEIAIWFGVPEKRMRLELLSVNTSDQAIEIKKILGHAPFYLVTSAIHMPRAMALCQKAGLHPIAAPTDFTLYWNDERWQKTWIPNAHNIVYVSIAMHEILGLTWAKVTGQI